MLIQKIEVICTWGDSPEVLLILGEAMFDLTANQAYALAERLQSAALQASQLKVLAQAGESQNDIG